MDEHALRTLEYDKIIARLARHTSFSAGRERALALHPSTDQREVVRRQRETAEARRLLRLKPRMGLGGAHDVRPQAAKAALGGLLEPAELLEIATTLECARELKYAIARLDEQLPLLADAVSVVEPLTRLSDDINRCINQRGEVTDQASPTLGAIRREVRTLHDRLYQRLEEILSAAVTRGVAQEPIITLRDGRYVIPVKADMRGQLRGIVHDVSSSGATVWLEPLAVVEQANRWREAQLEEQREVERILRRLSTDAGAASQAIGVNVEVLAVLDLSLAKTRFGEEIDAPELPYDGEEQPWIVEAPAQLHLLEARHPLLRKPVVPTTVTVGGAAYRVLLITGPNTGGKTVALKTAGLLALMAQAGLPVPADRGSRLPVFDGVYADIGDEQSIEQSLSTFSSHMTNIIRILERADARSLVLLDELAAGTDPGEGAALARAILCRLLEAGALTVATTHHGELKAFAHSTDGVANASVEFDVQTLSPTYHLSIGLPGRSNALEIAQRLGMPQDVVAAARESIAPEQRQVDEMLSDIRRERDDAASARRAEETARRESEQIRARLEERLETVDEERDRLVEQARTEIDRETERVRDLLRDAAREAERQKLAAAEDKLRRAKEEAARAAVRAAERPRRRPPERRRAAAPAGPRPEQIEPGDMVWLRGMERFGEALTAPDSKGEVEIRLGPLKSRIKLAQVDRVQRPRPSQAHGAITAELAPPPDVPVELDMRGHTVDEALPMVERYIDDAFRASVESVRVIHGKGTGTLRRVVRDALAKNPLVKSYEEAPREYGGEGVTIVHVAL